MGIQSMDAAFGIASEADTVWAISVINPGNRSDD